MKLQDKLIGVMNDYAELFSIKHNFTFDGWDKDIINMGMFGDFYVEFETVRYDIDSNASEDMFAKWYNFVMGDEDFIPYSTFVQVHLN